MSSVLVLDSIEPSLIVYGFGALFGVLSIVYFARDILLSLSLTVKLVIMYAVSLSLMIMGVSTANTAVSIILLVIGSSGYAISSFYFVKWYNRERMGRFILFAVSSGLFVLLGWLISSGTVYDINLQTGGIASSILIIIALILSFVDWKEKDKIQYTVNINEKVTENKIGTVTVKNNSRFFRRKFSFPSIELEFEINGIQDGCPVEIRSGISRSKTNTIGYGQEVTAELLTRKEHIKRRLQDEDISVPDSLHLSVQSHEDNQFEVKEDDTVELKVE